MYSDRNTLSGCVGGGKWAHCLIFQFDKPQVWIMNLWSHCTQTDKIHSVWCQCLQNLKPLRGKIAIKHMWIPFHTVRTVYYVYTYTRDPSSSVALRCLPLISASLSIKFLNKILSPRSPRSFLDKPELDIFSSITYHSSGNTEIWLPMNVIFFFVWSKDTSKTSYIRKHFWPSAPSLLSPCHFS